MTYGDFKDLARRAASDRVLRDETFNIAINPKYDGYQRDLMAYKFFDKKTALVVGLNLCQINKLQRNFINQLLKKF